ncbi:hypothetical protein PENDEC_c012G06094 [Penicillium decumbens]|uniref:PD-(D/E)XK nuclease-like domain-containing protein n=1 Tax=Penicillium decumbens TaxID=69771 RepID=A0A1V6PC33_PENDC|nr:hypothetical protein PENDEC_c012G06094 [Penicillium decumbens]
MESDSDLTILQWMDGLPDTSPFPLYDSKRTIKKGAKRGLKPGPSARKKQKTQDANDSTEATSPTGPAVGWSSPLEIASEPVSSMQTPVRGRSAGKSSSQRQQDWYLLSNCDPPIRFLCERKLVTFQPALGFFDTLLNGSQKRDDCDKHDSLENICLEARFCLSEHSPEDRWVPAVARELLSRAAKPSALPLVKEHLPRYYDPAGKTIILEKKIDCTLQLPRGIFENRDALANSERDRTFKDVSLNAYINCAFNQYLLGLGLEVKDGNGDRSEAECQIAVWCATYFNWMRSQRAGNDTLPPLVACVMVGHLFEFYIAYADEDSAASEPFRVYLWGPLRDLRGLLDTEDGVEHVFHTLQALVNHLKESFVEDMKKILCL